MARVLITGSADGLGKMAAELLIAQGHQVVLHARSKARAEETKRNVPQAQAVVTGDLSSITHCRSVAEQVNALLCQNFSKVRLQSSLALIFFPMQERSRLQAQSEEIRIVDCQISAQSASYIHRSGAMTSTFNGSGWMPAPSWSKPSVGDGIRRSYQGSNGIVQETHDYAHADLRHKQVTCWNHDRLL